MSQKRILLVDDHQLIIDGLRGFIEMEPDYKVVGEANNGNEAIRLAEILQPDVILMDIEMPEVSGIQASEEIKRTHSQIKVIIISMHQEKELIKKLVERGIDGYLLKNSSKEDVLSAIQTVLEDQPYFSQDVTDSLLNKSKTTNSNSADVATLASLTEREIEILKLVAEGLTNKEIGDHLFISHRTVDTHRTNLMKKLDICNVAGLIRFAYKSGLIQ
ncbi:MAG: response regulator transcription factor [Crocinitomicaceae bacterium]|nr:response regulator transcription factor [Crocinitomicaceae bacterium]